MAIHVESNRINWLRNPCFLTCGAYPKIICFSSATSDVENNPYECKLGSYYETSDLEIEYVSTIGDFIKLKLKSASNKDEYFYINKSRVKFE